MKAASIVNEAYCIIRVTCQCLVLIRDMGLGYFLYGLDRYCSFSSFCHCREYMIERLFICYDSTFNSPVVDCSLNPHVEGNGIESELLLFEITLIAFYHLAVYIFHKYFHLINI